MSRTSSTFVSPRLAPTSDWAQQTSTGVFRPPPALQLQPSTWADPYAYSKQQPYFLSESAAAPTAGDRGLDNNAAAPTASKGANTFRGAVQDGGAKGFSPYAAPFTGLSAPFNSTPSVAPAPPLVPLPSSPHESLLVVMRMIRYAVRAEQDTFLSLKEINRVLEAELLREQEQRRAASDQLAILSKSLALLNDIAKQQEAVITQLRSA